MNSFPRKNQRADPLLVYGTRAVLEAIRSGKEIDKILIQRGLNNELIKELIQEADAVNIPISKVPKEKLNRVKSKNHQGVICFISPISFASIENIIDQTYGKGKAPLILILDHITDVRNFGAIIRSAECFGIDAVVVPDKGSAQISGDAIKTSAGALNRVPICRSGNLKSTIKFLQENGLIVVACSEKGQEPIYKFDLKSPAAVVMGSEEKGISDEVIRSADYLATIPMLGKISSLNVSVATGVALFEVIRQRSLTE